MRSSWCRAKIRAEQTFDRVVRWLLCLPFLPWRYRGIVCATIAALLICVWLRVYWAKQQFANDLRQLAAEGTVMSFEKLNQTSQHSEPLQDLTSLFDETLRSIDTGWQANKKDSDLDIFDHSSELYYLAPPPKNSWPDHNRTRRFLEHFDDDLQSLNRMDFKRSIQFSGPRNLLVEEPEVNQLLKLRGLLFAQAFVYAHNGQIDKASQSIQLLLDISFALRHSNSFQIQNSRLEMAATAAEIIQTLKLTIDFEGDDLERWQQQLHDIDIQDALVRGVVSDRVIGLATLFESPAQRTADKVSLKRLLWKEAVGAILFPCAEERAFLDLTIAHEKCISGNADVKITTARIRNSPAFKWSRSPTLFHYLSRNPTSEILDKFEAKFAVADVAIAAERFRQQNGFWPKALNEMSTLTTVPSHLVYFAGGPNQVIVQSETLRKVAFKSSSSFDDFKTHQYFWGNRQGSIFGTTGRQPIATIELHLPTHTPRTVTRRVGFGRALQTERIAMFDDGQFRVAWADFPEDYIAERGRHQILRDGVEMMGVNSVNSVAENRAEFVEHKMIDMENTGQFSRPGFFEQRDRRVVAFFVRNRRVVLSLRFSRHEIKEKIDSKAFLESLYELTE